MQRNLREQNTTTTRFPPAACSRLQSDSGDGTKRGKKKRKKNKKRRTPLTIRLEQAISPNVVAILNLPTAAVLFLIQPQISTCSVNGLVFSCYRLVEQEVIYFKYIRVLFILPALYMPRPLSTVDKTSAMGFANLMVEDCHQFVLISPKWITCLLRKKIKNKK